MNKESLVVMRFYRLANISRDLFELVLNDGPINLKVFESRGNFFKAVIEDPMIVDFFGRAGENGEKMSKSRGNVVNPDDIIRDYGADTMRLYEMFIGDFEQSAPWNLRFRGESLRLR